VKSGFGKLWSVFRVGEVRVGFEMGKASEVLV